MRSSWTSVVAALVAAGTIAVTQASDCYEEEGNWYCSQVEAISYSNFGTAGQYQKVTYMDTAGTCDFATQTYSGGMAPFDGEVSWHFRGPIHLKQFAFYTLGSSGESKRSLHPSLHERRNARHHARRAHLDDTEAQDRREERSGAVADQKRDWSDWSDVAATTAAAAAVGPIPTEAASSMASSVAASADPAVDAGQDWVTATIDGKVVSWVNDYFGGGTTSTPSPSTTGDQMTATSSFEDDATGAVPVTASTVTASNTAETTAATSSSAAAATFTSQSSSSDLSESSVASSEAISSATTSSEEISSAVTSSEAISSAATSAVSATDLSYNSATASPPSTSEATSSSSSGATSPISVTPSVSSSPSTTLLPSSITSSSTSFAPTSTSTSTSVYSAATSITSSIPETLSYSSATSSSSPSSSTASPSSGFVTSALSTSPSASASTSEAASSTSSSVESSSSSSASAAASSTTGASGSGQWARQAYYNAEEAHADGLVFLNHDGGETSGVFDYTWGASLSYASADNSEGVASPVTLADTLIGDDSEFVIMTDTSCSDGTCSYYRPGNVAYHGFDGSSKLFLVEFSMPLSGDTGFNGDMPAVWMLNAQVPLTEQYGNCSCWESGCGEFDIFEVLNSGNTKTKSTWHGVDSLGDSDWFPRPTTATQKAAVVLDGGAGTAHIILLPSTTTFDATFSGDTVDGWLSSITSPSENIETALPG